MASCSTSSTGRDEARQITHENPKSTLGILWHSSNSSKQVGLSCHVGCETQWHIPTLLSTFTPLSALQMLLNSFVWSTNSRERGGGSVVAACFQGHKHATTMST